MKSTSLVLLAILTLGAAGAAYFARNQRSKTSSSATLPDRLLPEFTSKVNEVASIEVKKGKETTQLIKKGDEWTLGNRGGYLVEFEKVKQAVMAVADLRVLEAKTRLPERYHDLELDDPDKEGSTSARLTLKSRDGGVLAALVVGKTSWAGKPTVYVRKIDDPQSYQCQGELRLEESPTSWIKKDILKIDRDRVKSVEVQHADGELLKIRREKREDLDFAVEGIPAGRELSSSGAAGPLGSALSRLTAEDVASVSDLDLSGQPITSCQFRCFDGLALKVELADKDGKSWARFTPTFEAPPAPASQPAESAPAGAAKLASVEEAKKEVDDLNKLLGGWTYALPSYKVTSLRMRLAEFLKPLPTPPADTEPVKSSADSTETRDH